MTAVRFVDLERAGAALPDGWQGRAAAALADVSAAAPAERSAAINRHRAVWRELGFQDTCEATMRSDLARAKQVVEVRTQEELAVAGELPGWLGDEALHRSHQSALVRKDPEHYRRFFPDVPDDLPYVWPPTLARTVNPSASRPIDT